MRQVLNHDLDLGDWKVYNPAAPVDPTDVVRLMDLQAAVGAVGSPTASTYWVSSAAAAPTNGVNIGGLGSTTGELLKVAISAGVATPTLAAPGTDYPRPGSLYVVAGAGSGATAMPSGAVNIGGLGTVTGAFLKTTIAAGVASFAVDTNTYLTTAAAAATYQPLGSYLTAAYTEIQLNGVAYTHRAKINFLGAGATINDNSGAGTTEITVLGTGGGGGITQAYVLVEANGTPRAQRSVLNFLPRITAVDNSPNTDVDLASGIATPGTYTSVTVDTYGRVTAGTNPTIYYQTMKDSAGSSLTQRANLKHAARFAVTDSSPDTLIDLATSGASAGSYTNANVTVDVYGRITTVANGSTGAYAGTAAGAVLFTGANPYPITEDDSRLWYETGTFGASLTHSRLHVGNAATLNNATGIGSAMHLYSPDSSRATTLRIQGGASQVQWWRGLRGVSGGADDEWQVGAVLAGNLGGTHNGSLDFFANVGGGATGATYCFSVQGGGARVIGPLLISGASAIDPTWAGKSFIRFAESGTPAVSDSGTAHLRYRSSGGGGLNRLELSNNTGAYSPVATLADLAGGTGPTGAAGGDLGGTYPNPTVVAIEETGGPTRLTIASVTNGFLLSRSGTTVASVDPLSVGMNQDTLAWCMRGMQMNTFAPANWLITSSPTAAVSSRVEYLIGNYSPTQVRLFVDVQANTTASTSFVLQVTRNGSTIGSGITVTAGSTGEFSESISGSFASGDTWGLKVLIASETPEGQADFTAVVRVLESSP